MAATHEHLRYGQPAISRLATLMVAGHPARGDEGCRLIITK
jgi:hypothetical protein